MLQIPSLAAPVTIADINLLALDASPTVPRCDLSILLNTVLWAAALCPAELACELDLIAAIAF